LKYRWQPKSGQFDNNSSAILVVQPGIADQNAPHRLLMAG